MSEVATETETGSTGDESTESPSFFSEGNTFAEGWTEQLGEGYGSLSKFNGKGVDDLAKSYAELEKKIGQKTEGMVKLPGEDATPEEIQAFRQSLGVPDSADGYEISLSEEVLEGLDFDPETLGPIKEAAQSLGVTPAQLNGLVEAQANFEKAQLAGIQQSEEAATAELRKEWGVNADRKLMLVERAVEAGKLPPDHPLLSNTDLQRAFAELGAMISDGEVEPLTSNSTGSTAGDEARDIQTNPDNPFHAAYHAKISDRQKIKEARQRVTDLHAREST